MATITVDVEQKQFVMYRNEEIRFAFPTDMRELAQVVSLCGSHFFDEKTMRFFKSRCDYQFHATHDRSAVYFVTSEQHRDDPRRYTVRVWRPMEPASIDEPAGYTFGQFATLATARKHAAKLSRLVETIKA